jgi:hypothetical protein
MSSYAKIYTSALFLCLLLYANAADRRSASDHGLRAMPAAIAGVMRIDLCIRQKLQYAK